jgi:hypothetical protein
MKNLKTYRTLFSSVFCISAFTFGGSVIIPLMRKWKSNLVVDISGSDVAGGIIRLLLKASSLPHHQSRM